MTNLDKKKPVVKPGEALCSGCWAVAESKEAIGVWTITKFNHLDPVILCPACQYKFGDDFEKMLKAGL